MSTEVGKTNSKRKKKIVTRAVKESFDLNKELLTKVCRGEYSKIFISHILAYAKYSQIISIFMTLTKHSCSILQKFHFFS